MLRQLCCMAAIVCWTAVTTGDYLSAAAVDAAANDAAVGDAAVGDVELSSIGPIAFAPDGVLLVSDPMGHG